MSDVRIDRIKLLVAGNKHFQSVVDLLEKEGRLVKENCERLIDSNENRAEWKDFAKALKDKYEQLLKEYPAPLVRQLKLQLVFNELMDQLEKTFTKDQVEIKIGPNYEQLKTKEGGQVLIEFLKDAKLLNKKNCARILNLNKQNIYISDIVQRLTEGFTQSIKGEADDKKYEQIDTEEEGDQEKTISQQLFDKIINQIEQEVLEKEQKAREVLLKLEDKTDEYFYHLLEVIIPVIENEDNKEEIEHMDFVGSIGAINISLEAIKRKIAEEKKKRVVSFQALNQELEPFAENVVKLRQKIEEQKLQNSGQYYSLHVAIDKLEKTLALKKTLSDQKKLATEKLETFEQQILGYKKEIDTGTGFGAHRQIGWDRVISALCIICFPVGIYRFFKYGTLKPTESKKLIDESEKIISEHKSEPKNKR